MELGLISPNKFEYNLYVQAQDTHAHPPPPPTHTWISPPRHTKSSNPHERLQY
jgi:hypothetical protein